MDKRGLLVRATSVQHTALVIDVVEKRFKGIRLDILTHAHAVESLKGAVNGEIIPYLSNGSFGFLKVVGSPLFIALKKSGYDYIIIPTENINGAGYENIVMVSLAINPRNIVSCNKIGDIRVECKHILLGRLLKHYLFYPVAFFCSLFMIIKWSYSWHKLSKKI